jgi:hypothetical protein
MWGPNFEAKRILIFFVFAKIFKLLKITSGVQHILGVCDNAKLKNNAIFAIPLCGLFLTCRGNQKLLEVLVGIYTYMN